MPRGDLKGRGGPNPLPAIRLCIFCYEYPPVGGGGGQAAKNLAENLAAQGHSVSVVTSGFGALPGREFVNGVEVLRVRCRRKRADRSTVFEQLSYVSAAKRYARKKMPGYMPDAVLSVFSIPSGLAGFPASRAWGVPHIISLQGGDVPGFQGRELALYHRLSSPITSYLWRHSDAVIANSGGLADLAGKFLPDVNIEVIPMGVDASLFHPLREKRRDGETVQCAFIGRLVPQKQPMLMLAAFHRGFALCGGRLRLHIFGDGPLRREMEQTAIQYGIQDNVVFHGWLDFAQMPGALRSCDLFLQTSAFEGMSAALLQAMASGLIPVVFRCQGQEMLVNGHNGYVTEAGDVTAMAGRIQALAGDGRQRVQVSENARRTAEEQSWHFISRAYLNRIIKTLDPEGHILFDAATWLAARGEIKRLIADFTRKCRKTGPDALASEFLSERRAMEQGALFKRFAGAPLKGRVVLEIGSGFGTFLLGLIKKEGANAYGIEPGSDEYMNVAMSGYILKRAGIGETRTLCANGESLPFKSGGFDLVFSSNVLEHVKDPAAVLREAFRVLRTGGTMVIVVPNYNSLWEGHYRIPWLPVFNWRPLGRFYLRLLGRDTAFFDSLHCVTPKKIAAWLSSLEGKYAAEDVGPEIWAERICGSEFGTWGGLKPLQKIVTLLRKTGTGRLAARISVSLKMHTPIIMVVKKTESKMEE